MAADDFDTNPRLKAHFRYRVEVLGPEDFYERAKVLFDTFSFKKKYEFFCLLMGEDDINGLLDSGDRRFAAAIHQGSHVKRFARMFQQLCCDGGCALAEHISEHVIQLKVGNSKAVLGAVFSPVI